MEFCKQVQASIKWQRPLINPLRKKPYNLRPKERLTLKKLLKNNKALRVCYFFKEKLCDLLRLKSQNVRQCLKNIKKLKKMIRMLEYEASLELQKIGRTIRQWFAPIIRMWRFTKKQWNHERIPQKNETDPEKSIRLPKL